MGGASLQAVAIACNHYQHHRNVWTVPLLNRLYEIVRYLRRSPVAVERMQRDAASAEVLYAQLGARS